MGNFSRHSCGLFFLKSCNVYSRTLMSKIYKIHCIKKRTIICFRSGRSFFTFSKVNRANYFLYGRYILSHGLSSFSPFNLTLIFAPCFILKKQCLLRTLRSHDIVFFALHEILTCSVSKYRGQ